MEMELRDRLDTLHNAYEGLCLLALEAAQCDAEVVGHVLDELNKQLQLIIKQHA